MGTRNLFFATPLGRERGSKKTIAVFPLIVARCLTWPKLTYEAKGEHLYHVGGIVVGVGGKSTSKQTPTPQCKIIVVVVVVVAVLMVI